MDSFSRILSHHTLFQLTPGQLLCEPTETGCVQQYLLTGLHLQNYCHPVRNSHKRCRTIRFQYVKK